MENVDLGEGNLTLKYERQREDVVCNLSDENEMVKKFDMASGDIINFKILQFPADEANI